MRVTLIYLFENYAKRIVMILGALIFALAGGLVLVEHVKPYAVYADGTKVNDPYVITVEEEELFLVEDRVTAEKVITNVMEEYVPEGSQVNKIVLDKNIGIGHKTLRRSDMGEKVLTEAEAVAYILDANESEEPLFNATITAEKGSITSVEPQIEVQETDELYQGDYIIQTVGTEGSQLITKKVTSINGTITDTETVDSVIVDYGQATIALKGTKEVPADTIWQDYSGEVIGTGNGAKVANYGMNFLGNPYVYGGASLTGGTDCSGFVMSLYKKVFGISLPHSSSAQAKCGKRISLAQARPGDVVCYSGHVAIYLGNNKIVHAANPRKDICVSSVHYKPILTVRRIVQ